MESYFSSKGHKDIVLFGSPITPMNVVRNLGVILDENMTMSEHIARVCRNCYYQLRQVRRIKKSMMAIKFKNTFGSCFCA